MASGRLCLFMKILPLLVVLFVAATASAQNRAAYEAVLVPVFQEGAGDHGSRWVTELRLFNSASTVAGFVNPVSTLGPECQLGACSSALYPGQPVWFNNAPNLPFGIVLYEPRSHAGSVHYNLRIRDLSRQLQTWGTEIPVVRESEMSTQAIHLFDLPTSTAFRNSLRIYSLSDEPQVRVQVYGHPDGVERELVDETVKLVRTPYDRPDFPMLPSYYGIHDIATVFPRLRDFALVRVAISSPDAIPFWAFVSVTNNDTQHVTTITPQLR